MENYILFAQNKSASPLAAGGGRSINDLFAQVHFGKAENFARALNQRFYIMGNCIISHYIKIGLAHIAQALSEQYPDKQKEAESNLIDTASFAQYIIFHDTIVPWPKFPVNAKLVSEKSLFCLSKVSALFAEPLHKHCFKTHV